MTRPHVPLRRGQQRIFGGVCAGLAATLDVDVTLVRVVFVLLAFVQGLGILAYVLLWLLMPEAGADQPWSVGAATHSMTQDVARIGNQVRGTLQPAAALPSADAAAPPAASTPPPAPSSARGRNVWPGVLLVVVGFAILAGNLGWTWWSWSIGMPVLLIAAGIWLLARRVR